MPGRLLYDGAALAEASGNVVVTLQYRLGPLGWLVHPALDAEAPDTRSGNYALEDLVAALEWIRRDIAAFGGNSDARDDLRRIRRRRERLRPARLASRRWALHLRPDRKRRLRRRHAQHGTRHRRNAGWQRRLQHRSGRRCLPAREIFGRTAGGAASRGEPHRQPGALPADCRRHSAADRAARCDPQRSAQPRAYRHRHERRRDGSRRAAHLQRGAVPAHPRQHLPQPRGARAGRERVFVRPPSAPRAAPTSRLHPTSNSSARLVRSRAPS